MFRMKGIPLKGTSSVAVVWIPKSDYAYRMYCRFFLLDNSSCIALISDIHVTMQNRHFYPPWQSYTLSSWTKRKGVFRMNAIPLKGAPAGMATKARHCRLHLSPHSVSHKYMPPTLFSNLGHRLRLPHNARH